MKVFLFFAAVLILGALQAALNHLPDLLLICAIIAALSLPWKPALALAAFAGLFKDCFAANSGGINTLFFVLWSFLIIRLNRKITIDNNFMRALLVFIVALAHNTAGGITLLYLGTVVPPGIFLRIAVLNSLYTAAVFIPLLNTAKRFILENRNFR